MQSTGKNSNIKLVQYRSTPDKDHYIVEQLQTGEFYEMPRPAVEAMEALEKGIAPEQIESDLIHKYPDEDINMMDFLAQLKDMGFLSDDGNDPYVGNKVYTHQQSSMFISSRLSRILFHRLVMPLYAIFFFANIVYFIIHPELFPHPRDLFPFQSMVLNIIVSLVVSVFLLALHESGHVMAANAYGIIPSVRISHRLFVPVIETQMPTIWRLPRGSRNVPLLAGLFMDHAILFVSLSILILVPMLSVTMTGILALVIFQLVMMSLYQCMFFMKTDLYYLIQNVTGSYNLLENAHVWLKGKLPFIRNQNSTVIYEQERYIVRGYALFYILGLVFSVIILIVYVIPQSIYSFSMSLERLIKPSPAITKADAIIFFVQFMVYTGLLVYSWRKKYMEAKRE